MSPRIRRRGFIAVPPNRKTKWSCTIDGIDVTNFISGKFPWGLLTEELICEIELDNSGEDFTNKFKENDEIIFLMDFTGGTTVQFKGEIEEIRSKVNASGFILGIKGAHFTSRLLDIMITEEFKGATISDIKTSLMDNLSDYTSNNVESNTDTLDIKFVNKPLLDCLIEVDIQADSDSYIDHDKDLNSFKKNSKTNLVPHVTEEGLLELRGLGTDSADKRTKVTVYGEAGGLPVISSSAETGVRVKEKIITDNTVVDEDQAFSLSVAEKDRLKDPAAQGSALTLFMLTLKPGDRIYVISNPHKVHGLFRVVKFVFNVPGETMEILFNQERSIPKLFKDRIRKEIGQETIVNPFKMTNSFNFGSESGFIESKMDASASNAVEFSEGDLRLISGNESGDMISIQKDTPVIVKSVHLLVTGETPTGTNYYINADGTNNWQQISKDTEETVTTQGSKFRLRIELTSTDTRIKSAALLYK